MLVALAAGCLPCAEAQTLPPRIFLEQVVTGLQKPIDIANAGDGTNRLFIAEQNTGRIRIYDLNQGMLLATPFLDLSALIDPLADFEGLLALTFHPNYEVNGRFFVMYVDNNFHQVVARFSVSMDPNVANPAPDVILLDIPHPEVQFPHYGGQLQFGPDGFLYISLGDGTAAEDANNHGQRLDVLLGKVLRLDVDSASPYAIPPTNPFVGTPGARGEIWARGLRNPWRFSFDRDTGEMFIADVGEGRREEVNHQAASSPGGENYGWRRMEGTLCFNPSSNCNDGTLKLPAFEYPHSADPCGGSISGGYRYRGQRFPQMEGVYLFGEFCFKRIYGAVQAQDGTWSFSELLNPNFNIVTFGEDEVGEVYVTDFFSGRLHRIGANNPLPALTELSPENVAAGGSGFVLTVTGSGFVPQSVVKWNDSNRATSFQSTSELTATILASDIVAEGTAQVTVFNPTPVGGTSNPLPVAVLLPHPMNDAATTNEDSAVDINVLANDTGASGLSVASFSQGANGSVSNQGGGVLRYTPAANFNGVDSFTYNVTDGVNTAGATVNVTINPVNDPPSFTGGPNQTVVEDSSAQSVPGWATNISPGAANEAGQTLTFNVTNNTNPGLFSAQPAVSPTGTLTFTPAADANGSASVTIVLMDNGGVANGGSNTSAPFPFTITVTPVNDPPVINSITPNPASPAPATSNSGASITFTASITDPDGGGPTFSWSGGCGDSTAASPALTCPIGMNTVNVTVDDGAGGSAMSSTVVTVTDYTVAATCTSGMPPCNSDTMATLPAGQGVNFNLTATGVNGTYNANITFSCMNLPAQTSCSFTPSNTIGGAPPGGSTITLRIQTTAPISAHLQAPHRLPESTAPLWAFWMGVPGLALSGLVLASGRGKRRGLGTLCLLVVVLAMGAMLAACGGGGGRRRKLRADLPPGHARRQPQRHRSRCWQWHARSARQPDNRSSVAVPRAAHTKKRRRKGLTGEQKANTIRLMSHTAHCVPSNGTSLSPLRGARDKQSKPTALRAPAVAPGPLGQGPGPILPLLTPRLPLGVVSESRTTDPTSRCAGLRTSPLGANAATEPTAGFVGIARLAALSPVEREKHEVTYYRLPVRSVLNRVDSRRVGFPWSINPYRGCEFGCQYCYARYTHEYMELDPTEFERKIYVKEGAASRLRAELTPERVLGQHIAIGAATDPYQPAERQFGVTRAILEVLLEFSRQLPPSGLSLSITTKSNLVLKDAALLSELARCHRLHINLSVTTLNARLARVLEPRAPRPDLRLEAVRRLNELGIPAGVFAAPILPGITDRAEDLEALARAAAGADARWLCANVVFLMPSSQKKFFPFLAQKFPRLLKQYRKWYTRTGYAPQEYRRKISSLMSHLRGRYGLSGRWPDDDPAPDYSALVAPPPPQLVLPLDYSVRCSVDFH